MPNRLAHPDQSGSRRVIGLFAVRRASARERLVAFALLIAIASAALVLSLHHPSSMTWLPACPLKDSLGIECPGCGSTRAVHHLLQWQPDQAWRHNQAMILLGLPIVATLLLDICAMLVGARRIVFCPGRRLGIALAIALVGYMVVRNLPFAEFDDLRPPVAATVGDASGTPFEPGRNNEIKPCSEH